MLARRIIVIGSGPYWYLISLFWSVAFLFFCYRIKNGRIFLYSGVLFGFLLEILYTCFRDVLNDLTLFRLIFKMIKYLWSSEFNFLMFGIPFMGIGWFLAENKLEWSLRKAAIVFFISTAFRVVEYTYNFAMHSDVNRVQIDFAFIPQALAYFMFMNAWKPEIRKGQSLMLRQLSSTIYYSHVIFLYNVLNPVMNRFTTLPTYAGSMIFPKVLVVLCMCTLFFIIVKKLNIRHLNVLING